VISVQAVTGLLVVFKHGGIAAVEVTQIPAATAAKRTEAEKSGNSRGSCLTVPGQPIRNSIFIVPSVHIVDTGKTPLGAGGAVRLLMISALAATARIRFNAELVK
jgi:hypothetical protein